jgi:hypothetical protein
MEAVLYVHQADIWSVNGLQGKVYLSVIQLN